MTDGYMILKNQSLLNVIKNTDAKVILTLSSMSKDNINQPWLSEVLPRTHILFCDELEYNLIDLKNSKMPDICVKTLGASGCEVYTDKKWRHYGPAPLKKSEIVNTTGAGDAFAAGFIYALIKSYSLNKIVDIANDVSTRVLKSELSYISR